MTVAHPVLVLRHLATTLAPVVRSEQHALELVEFAVEHVLRDGLVLPADLRGDRVLAAVVKQRGGEPPTESYAETRAVQILRSWGWSCWRQMPVYEHGRLLHRADLVVPFGRVTGRPGVMAPWCGLIIEIDSRQFHEMRFEEDHRRQSAYDRLGLHWISLTPNQLEHQRRASRSAIEGALTRASMQPNRPFSRAERALGT